MHSAAISVRSALRHPRAVPQERPHVVHLAVTRARIAAAAIDLLHDHRGFRQAEAGAAVFLRDQRGEPARLGERVDDASGYARASSISRKYASGKFAQSARTASRI